VGIGFGLQQVVQNFVSGVILLVERPVKVGDWVNVDGVEGNIRRIRVRATEIESFDRSTMIVPNSDLITKKVQNKTLGDPHARIKLELSIGNAADAQRASEAILDVAAGLPQILKEPKPAVYIDALAAGGAVDFVSYLFVASARDVYKTRSALYFAVLEAFAEAGIGLAGVAAPTNVIVEPGPTMQGLLAGRSDAKAAANGETSPRQATASDGAEAAAPGSKAPTDPRTGEPNRSWEQADR
jgi:potassium efflux system protein